MMEGFEFAQLAEVLQAQGVSGNETHIADVLESFISSSCRSVKKDCMGNLLCLFGYAYGKKKIMIESHMDEIGFTVRSIDENGYVLVNMIGYIDDRVTIGKPVIICTAEGKKNGVIIYYGTSDIEGGAGGVFVGKKAFAIDVGAKNASEAVNEGIRIGDPVIWGYDTSRIGFGSEITSKAMDARLGCFAICQALRRLYEHVNDVNITAAFTVQEENGRKGIIPVIREEMPDYLIVFDIMGASSHSSNQEDMHIRTGSGIGITLAQATIDPTDGDGAFIANPYLFSLAKKTCEELSIPYQIDIHAADSASFVTNAGIGYALCGGVPTLQVCIAIKYMHSASETCSMNDIENLIRFLEHFILKLSSK